MDNSIDPALARRIVEDNVRVHDAEAEHYDVLHTEIFNRYEQRILWRLLRQADSYVLTGAPRRALDIGAGTGNITLKLLTMGYEVVALDISSAMLGRLRAKVGERARSVCQPADEFLLEHTAERFDLITLSSVLHHLPHYGETMLRCLAALKDGGSMLILHEPLAGYSKPNDSFPARVVSSVANRAWYHLQKRRGALLTIDYTFSDYHAAAGVSPQEVGAVMEGAGGKIILVHHHRVERYALAAYINNSILRAAPNNFCMLVQKPAPSGPRKPSSGP